MLKKIFVMLVLVTMAFVSFGSVAAEEISKTEAEKLVSEYVYEGEYAETTFTIYHNGKPYYEICFYDKISDRYNGSIIIDATSGEIVKDKDTAREIFYASERNLGPDFTSEGLANTRDTIQYFREMEATQKIALANATQMLKKADVSSECRRLCDKHHKSWEKVIDDFSKMADYSEEIYEIQRPLVDKLETEKVKEFVAKNNEFADWLETTAIKDWEDYRSNYIAFIDKLISETSDLEEKAIHEANKISEVAFADATIQGFEDEVNRWRKEEKDVMEGTEMSYGVNWTMDRMDDRLVLVKPTLSPTPTPMLSPTPSPTPTPTPEEKGVPGFEAVFAIAGLLVITYLLRRRG